MRVLWENVEDNVLRGIPVYFVVKNIVSTFDPRLNKTLTFLRERLRISGGRQEDVELTAKIDKLSNLHLHVDSM